MPTKEQALAGFAAILLLCAVAGLLVFWGIHERWDRGTSVGVAGLAVALLGFGLAIYEIRKSRSVATETKKAVLRTLKGVSASQTIRMIEQLRSAARELDGAKKNEDAMRHPIEIWITVGSEIREPLREHFGATLPGLESLDASMKAAQSTRAAMRREDGSARTSVSSCLETMDKAIEQLGPLHQRLFLTIDETDGNA